MPENKYQFELPTHQRSIIKVIGVGGGGSNAVNHMYNQGIRDVEFVVVNTDSQALKSSPIPNRLQIGTNLTEGLGAGANPEKGKNAAIESKEEVRDLLSKDTKMVFITAGMGGGTGTGAAPELARVAKELGILTVGIVTLPFAWEGKKKLAQAASGINLLKENCDTVIVILNDKLREIYGNLPIREAFAEADNILTTAAKGIAEIITVPGYVNVDFEDVKTVMKDSGAAVMGSSLAKGENRARRAAEEAISSPLLNSRNIHGAQKILLSIISGEEAELQMDELTEITEYIQEKAGEDAEMIFGHGVDPELGENIRVTVIATGFISEEEPISSNAPYVENKRVIDLESNKTIENKQNAFFQAPQPQPQPEREPETTNKGYAFEKPVAASPRPEPQPEPVQQVPFEFFTHQDETDNEQDEWVDEDLIREEELRMKRQALMDKAKDRVRNIKNLRPATNLGEPEELKGLLDVPAYLRKNVRLKEVPHSSEKNISRYNLNDENQILGNNKFLHDNVD
ncbi:cell division protein FtsZ [Cesiribacter andamanensis]|uniref:Cell division protein FtsZ n=1 Tax=Cesiribacter andamanensis AMV16 TaxID=1279009 RepID=M7NYU5_9BACT|nr:cell division protein FtsZ [Cesiribacter andamanensis]EMR03549.1 Cell division protein FtsZ [Cesiribacter andamanensis AMV16]